MFKVILWVVLLSFARDQQAYQTEEPPTTPNVFIDCVYPDHGRAGDTVSITGNGFGQDPAGLRVMVGGAPANVERITVVNPSYQVLQVRLSADAAGGGVTIGVGGQLATFANPFCAEPVI